MFCCGSSWREIGSRGSASTGRRPKVCGRDITGNRVHKRRWNLVRHAQPSRDVAGNWVSNEFRGASASYVIPGDGISPSARNLARAERVIDFTSEDRSSEVIDNRRAVGDELWPEYRREVATPFRGGRQCVCVG